jgi:hypothetical protein
MYMVCSQQSSGGFLWSLPLFSLWQLTQADPGPPPFSSINSMPANSNPGARIVHLKDESGPV